MATREEIRERVGKDGVQYLLVQFVDLHGSAKVKLVPAGHLDDVIDDGAAFAGAALPVAIASIISTPLHYYSDYFWSDGDMVNPWGGVESMLTHTISSLYDLPSAHAPMLESQDVLDIETGVVVCPVFRPAF